MRANPKRPAPPSDFHEAEKKELWEFLFSNVDVDPQGGAFRVSDQRLLILRPEALVDLQKHLEGTIGLSSKGFLYLAGERSAREGHDLFASLAPSGADARDPLDVLRERVAAMALLGWGRLEVAAEEPSAHRFLVSLDDSPLAEAYGNSKKPVCHLLAGWIAGTAQAVLGESLLCEEIACRAQGKARCEFRLRPTPYG